MNYLHNDQLLTKRTEGYLQVSTHTKPLCPKLALQFETTEKVLFFEKKLQVTTTIILSLKPQQKYFLFLSSSPSHWCNIFTINNGIGDKWYLISSHIIKFKSNY